MSSKKSISKEEMGQGLWQLCCNLAESFCTNLKPKFQGRGFLRTPAEETTFMLEALILHIWITSMELGSKDRDVLDVLHGYFNRWNPVASVSLADRYSEYYNAFSKDLELRAKNLMPLALTETALQWMLNKGKPCGEGFGFETAIETDSRITAVLRAVREFRAEFELFGAPPKQRTMLDNVQEAGGKLIVAGYRRIAAQHGCAPTAKTTDQKIIEIYAKVGTAFHQGEQKGGERVPALYLNTIVLKFLQVYEMMGEQRLQEHLQYEVEKYLAEGLRPDYKQELRLF